MSVQRTTYFKGNFSGLFLGKERQALPFYRFNEISWHQLKITDVESIDPYDPWEITTGNSWYRKKLKPYYNWWVSKQIHFRWPEIRSKRDFPWIRSVKWQFPVLADRPHMIIPLNDEYQLRESLHEVVIKRMEITDPHVEWIGGYREATGIIYFQLKYDVAPPTAEKPDAKKEDVTPEPVIESKETTDTSSDGLNNVWKINQQLLGSDTSISATQKPLQMSSRGNFFWRWFMLLWLICCLWKLPWLFIPSLLLFGGISFFRHFRGACLGLLASLLVFGLIGAGLMAYLRQGGFREVEQKEQKDGNVHIYPPKKGDAKDLLSEKSVDWWDFFDKKYSLSYLTSATAFFESQQIHSEAVSQISASNSIEMFHQIYEVMERMDAPKIDSIVGKLRAKARQKGLNTLRTAEMVCTFVQEIPYFLVHDLDCKRAVQEAGSGFMVEYHMQNKPCLPNIPAGVQSPYEFMHNLKGDCDTRSLLAYTILKKMGIPASVWVSEAYGHSVLGVALPVASGFYKEINGIKHYAVELTAKGFRLGMISPEQQIRSNWDIALFSNP